MTEIARFAENSLFCPFAPFFGETQTSQKGRKKGANRKNREGNFCGIGTYRMPLEFIGITPNHSESLRANRNQSE